MAVQTPPYCIQASSHGAALFRQAVTSMLGAAQPGTLAAGDGGVVNTNDLAVTQNGTPNMSVNVAGGSCWIPQTNAANGGLYFGLNSGTVNLAISASNPTNPRIDTVVATVNDAAYSGSTNNWVLQVLTGTPTAGATLSNLNGAAALAASSIVIAYVLVPANATTIVTADLLDERQFVPTAGRPSTSYHAGAYRNASWIMATSLSVIPFDTLGAEGDPNGNFSLSTGLYTCPVEGLYLVEGGLTMATTVSNNTYQLSAMQNGSEVRRLAESIWPPTVVVGASGATKIKAAAGDTLGIGQAMNGGTPYTGQAAAWCSFQLLGQ